MTLNGKVAIVTGAGSGIGRAVALRLAREGAGIVAGDVNSETAQATAEEVRALGRSALDLRVDVSDVTQLQGMVDKAVDNCGRIDILVSCAGVVQMKRMLDITEADWDWIFSVNTKGLFFTLQAVARQMVRQKSGTIVNISSISGRGPRAIHVHYAASKAAVISITRSAAADLAPFGITVNTVCPGNVETPMLERVGQEMGAVLGVQPDEWKRQRLPQIPLGRLQKPEDVANAVAFLASPEACNITGQALNVDGGFQMS